MDERPQNAQVLDATIARLDEKVTGLQTAFADWKAASEKGIEVALAGSEKATNAALTAQKEAAAKAEEASTKQLEAHNGLIRKMDAMVQTFPTKESVKKDFDVRDQRITTLDRSVARVYGVAAGVGGFASLLSAIAIFLAGQGA